MNGYENEFIKFDTVKIRTNINHLISKNIEFNKNYINGLLVGEDCNSKKNKSIPYNLYIGISYTSQSLTLEFSSKVLLDEYPKLITKNTFKRCLENINKLGICTLDIDAIYDDCYFSDVDITNDIDYTLTDKVLSSLNLCVNNYRRFKMKPYGKTGITFNKDVKKESDISLTIYNKEMELELSKNKKFLSLTNNPDAIKDYFQGKVRFEMTLDTPKKICDFLNIENTHITNVFKSEVNPLLTQFNLIFGNDEILNKSYIKNYETYAMNAIIEKHNGDIKKIEQEMKDLHLYSYKSRKCFSIRMDKIKLLIQQRNNKSYNSNIILSEIRKKLTQKL